MSEAEKRRKDRQELEELYKAIEPAKNEHIARRAIAIAEYYLTKVENQAKHIRDLEARNARSERKRGRWIHYDEGDFDYDYKCSNCGYAVWDDSDFCPGCGADMRGEQNE